MKRFFNYYFLFLLYGLLLIAGCSSARKTPAIQNLTARYNIMYNAENLLNNSRETTEKVISEDYTQLLPVYKEPTIESAEINAPILDSVIQKANSIIFKKADSKYVSDAYFLIAEANFQKANYFDAAEFYTYIYNSYPNEVGLSQLSKSRKARALIQLDYPEQAKTVLDSAFIRIDSSTVALSDLYAIKAQLFISHNRLKDAEEMIHQALKAQPSRKQKIRWTYLLAQLQEENKDPEKAYASYSIITKSNAPFEMAFNADLNRIRIDNEQTGNKQDKIIILKSLLKRPNNIDFHDQIYYKIGNIYQERKQFGEAFKSYTKSITSNTENINQKGLSYLKLAELTFQEGQYTLSSTYYDSTLSTLPSTYPHYQLIKRKAASLTFLADRFNRINLEKQLQVWAELPEQYLKIKLDSLIRNLSEIKSDGAFQTTTNDLLANSNQAVESGLNGTFYFYNPTALSKGRVDFIQRWGNRKNSDNWRISSNSDIEISSIASTPVADTLNSNLSYATKFNAYLDRIPLTKQRMNLSNERIAAAMYEIGDFYRTELQENEEAQKTFETLIALYPESLSASSAIYSLYLLNLDDNPRMAETYKNLLINKYPNFNFTQSTLNPSFSIRSAEKEKMLNQDYTAIFNLYTQKQYKEVIQFIKEFENRHNRNFLSPQLAYLNALAVGHLQKLPAFEESLQSIIATYPEDSLVTPLSKQQLQYVNQNRADLMNRITALLENDSMSEIYEPELVTDIDKSTKRPSALPIKPRQNNTTEKNLNETKLTEGLVVNKNLSTDEAQFSLPDTAEYYFVIHILNAATNLSPSRFGIGQFNRTRYVSLPIKHQLKVVNKENQVIFVGPFKSKSSVNAYKNNFVPLIKDIMKIPSDKYNTFIITKEGLDKLNTSTVIQSYLEYFKKSQ